MQVLEQRTRQVTGPWGDFSKSPVCCPGLTFQAQDTKPPPEFRLLKPAEPGRSQANGELETRPTWGDFPKSPVCYPGLTFQAQDTKPPPEFRLLRPAEPGRSQANGELETRPTLRAGA